MDYDVIVIGGGAAGLSGAITLARSRRSVLVIDGGSPRNAPADGVHGFLGHDGVSPLDLVARGRRELAEYGGDVTTVDVANVRSIDGGFDVDGITARRLLVATGLVDELPDVPGLRAHWGHDVVHCPYCHGWEVRDRAIAVIASGPNATHQALLFSQLSKEVTLLGNGQVIGDDDRVKLAARGVAVIDESVVEVVGEQRVAGVRLASGRNVDCEAIVVAPFFRANSAVLEQLGLDPVPFEMNGIAVGTHVPADPTGRTAVAGVWVAGNVTNPGAQAVHSAAAGVSAGAMINMDLIEEDVSSRQPPRSRGGRRPGRA